MVLYELKTGISSSLCSSHRTGPSRECTVSVLHRCGVLLCWVPLTTSKLSVTATAPRRGRSSVGAQSKPELFRRIPVTGQLTAAALCAVCVM